MFHSLFYIYFLINIVYTENNQCSLLNNKLLKYGIPIHSQQKTFLGIRLCQNVINNYCCPQIYEDKIQNATATELYHLFELYSIHLYEPLIRLNIELNDTIVKLIESSRNETHLMLQYGFKTFYNSYRSSLDMFFNNLLTITYKNYHYDIKRNIEELFHNILRITIGLNNDNKPLIPSYLLCLWRNHPFGNRPNVIANQLEMNLGKLFHLNELFKLSTELIQITSTSVTTDYHCIDSYMQLSYCNLCSGRKELPCLSNCVNVIESCLVNISLINDVWMNFLDSIENVAYFNGIEKVLSSISISISDALMTFFNSDGMQNKDIINQCGYIHIRREIFDNDQKFHNEHRNSLSLLDKQLMSMKQSLQIYRSFWLMLPKQICRADGLSATDEQTCWTGNSISQDKRQSIRTNYDKPLSLRLQWILKEIREKSQILRNIQSITTVINISTTTMNTLLNLTDDLDDYPSDNEFHYSDYAYEDSLDGLTSTPSSSSITTTTLQSSSISLYDDTSIDDINTVSYYDYGEQDVYSDDEIDETSTQQLSIVTTTNIVRLPSYHHRRPVIWNINIGDNENFNQPPKQQQQQQYNSSISLHCSFLLLLLLLITFVLT